jgi:hypothetical protein
MKCHLSLIAALLLLVSPGVFAQQGAPEPSADVAFWVAYWGRPEVIMFGPDQEDFNKRMPEIMFPWDDHEGPTNPSALDDTVSVG